VNILFCSPSPLVRELGVPKVLIELAEELQPLGWSCTLLGPEEVARAPGSGRGSSYAEDLRAYLRRHAAAFDVVDYDHRYLPYAREEFPRDTLVVARSFLLTHHLETFPIPGSRGLRGWAGHVIKGPARRAELQRALQAATRSCWEADLINVNNDAARDELVGRGLPERKIVVLAHGIDRARRAPFEAVSSAPPAQPVVAFVGSFDVRKGAQDFPAIVHAIAAAVPEARFRLLGTGGTYQTAPAVLRHFGPGVRSRIEVVPRFGAEALPELLAPCSVGIFPSYVEGFGYAVLEMLAAALPVIAYDVPGPPMMLPPEYLVDRGDAAGLSAKVVALLRDPVRLADARRWARQRSRQFCWQEIAAATSAIYREARATRRGASRPPLAPPGPAVPLLRGAR
jgi:glycosyltransferase involved in cell wall biosynthesis